MAQRDKKEEPTELRAPEITLCANSCGFPGNPATQNLCQSCFAAAMSSSASPASPSSSPAPAPRPVEVAPPAAPPVEVVVASPAADLAASAAAAPAPEAARAPASRCSSCRKRVGLTGFRCRCGELFCGAHRYSDRHGCSYDYKGAARDAIARENPVVRASKIVRF
ncbi:unnamed protein product [Urochloa decumbens]|uniref:Uncharacterized protein n=1 Tax=Urochloa decumbens TaxID=240449 RepID=A0ABC9FTI9_9POAL